MSMAHETGSSATKGVNHRSAQRRDFALLFARSVLSFLGKATTPLILERTSTKVEI
jgi:hypothetical protein